VAWSRQERKADTALPPTTQTFSKGLLSMLATTIDAWETAKEKRRTREYAGRLTSSTGTSWEEEKLKYEVW